MKRFSSREGYDAYPDVFNTRELQIHANQNRYLNQLGSEIAQETKNETRRRF